jgi:hypothetical protein
MRRFRVLAFVIAGAALISLGMYAYAGRLAVARANSGPANATHHVKFPDVDYSKLRISLQRSACFGMCPDYIVTISGDGSAVFTTDYRPVDPVAGVHREFSRSVGVLVPGTHRTKIDPNAVRTLVQQFQDAGFFDLKNEYRYGATDAPTYVISIDTGHGSKRIIDYIGRQAGMPASVTALEDAIDKTAGTRRWIDGTPDAIPLLQAEGFHFDSPIGLDLMTKAAERGDVATMERLHALGAPLVGDPSSGPLVAAASASQMSALSWLLSHGVGDDPKVLLGGLAEAVRSDSDEAFDRLRDLVGPKPITPEIATNLLRQAAENGNVRMASYFLQFHPRLNGSANDRAIEDPPLWAAAQHSCPEEGSHPNCDHRKVVRMLLDAGADPRWFHPVYRNSVFFQVSDPEIAKMLLARGADPNFKDSDGEPIIFSIDNEDVALVMIEAGLSLRSVRPADKMTLRGWATYQKWPHVLALLDRAGLLKSHER